MIALQIITPEVASFIGFLAFTLFLLLAFTISYAKRDVNIEITFLEFRR